MDFDAFLAAVVAGLVTLAVILFGPWLVDELPASVLEAALYLVGVAAVVSGSSLLARKRRPK